MAHAVKSPQDILEYWFSDVDPKGRPRDRNEMWWKKNADIDAEIKALFEPTLEASARGELADWRSSKEGRLAHIILVDQMSRNMHRDTALMFAQDDLGQELSLLCSISDEYYANYHERMFQYMPLMHAENLAMQKLCVHLFSREIALGREENKEAAQNNHGFAERHLTIIERFGRFPHRNDILSRASTPEEVAFLKEPGSSF